MSTPHLCTIGYKVFPTMEKRRRFGDKYWIIEVCGKGNTPVT